MKDTYDLAIIGGGAAGLIAAPFAVQLGARVAFIKKTVSGVTAPGQVAYRAKH